MPDRIRAARRWLGRILSASLVVALGGVMLMGGLVVAERLIIRAPVFSQAVSQAIDSLGDLLDVEAPGPGDVGKVLSWDGSKAVWVTPAGDTGPQAYRYWRLVNNESADNRWVITDIEMSSAETPETMFTESDIAAMTGSHPCQTDTENADGVTLDAVTNDARILAKYHDVSNGAGDCNFFADGGSWPMWIEIAFNEPQALGGFRFKQRHICGNTGYYPTEITLQASNSTGNFTTIGVWALEKINPDDPDTHRGCFYQPVDKPAGGYYPVLY